MMRGLLFASVALVHAIDECGDASDCTSCLTPTHGGGNCGWCAPSAVQYADGTVGNRCADIRDHSHGGGWQCSGKLMTDQCLAGWVCGGNATNYQCIPAARPGDGNPVFSDCQAGCTPRPSFKCTDPSTAQCVACADPNDPDCTTDYQACQSSCVDESLYSCNVLNGTCEKCDTISPSCVSKAACSGSCSVKYECEFPTNLTAQPQCKVCTDPSSNTCQYATSDDCSAGCDWQYECDLHGPSGATCKKTAHGIPRLEWCTEQCHATYTCDEEAKTCNVTQGGGGKFTNKTTCDSQCPTKPTNSTPLELLGVWRGLAIQNNFVRGEWTANVTETHFALYDPNLSVYVSGTAQHRVVQHASATGELWINSTAGKFVGMVRMLYGDADLHPELSYVTLAVSETTPGTVLADYDTGMVGPSDKVLGMYKCKADQINCKFHLPPMFTKPKPKLPARFELAATNGDACNVYANCSSCIGATAGPLSCGWCTHPVHYNDSSTPQYQCAGHSAGVPSGWTCYGIYRTLTCFDYCCDAPSGTCSQCEAGTGLPTKASCDSQCSAPSPWSRCSFSGIYRGLQIDLNYPYGEWDLNFGVYTNYTTANFTFVPTNYSFGGTIQCKNPEHPSEVGTEGEFKLALTNGTTLYGIYYDGGDQAETHGLSIALSNKGATTPPADFPSAMPGLNSTVYGFQKCAGYKSHVCKF